MGIEIRSSMTGGFNIANILGAVGAGLGLGLDPKAIARGIRDLPAVPGRLQAVPNRQGIHVLVDYAHKPDALEKVLRTLQGVKDKKRIITVFGCGGDRDRTKRPVMGKIAVELSDHVFVTSDNPRTEVSKAIIAEILEGMRGYSNYVVEEDRKQRFLKQFAKRIPAMWF